MHNPPKKREVKLSTKERNQLILREGPEYAVTEGLVPIQQYDRLVRSTNLHQLRTMAPAPLTTLDNHWFVGPSGAGKSKSARGLCPTAFVKLPNKWWDGYTGQPDVIIDDFAKEHSVLRTHLLQWADHYPTPVECKGSTQLIRPKRIVVTSNYTIDEIWPEPKDHKPMFRRFKVTKFD